jgi:hypothetical protein
MLLVELRVAPVPKPQARPVVALILNERETMPVKVPVEVAVSVELPLVPSGTVRDVGLATRV